MYSIRISKDELMNLFTTTERSLTVDGRKVTFLGARATSNPDRVILIVRFAMMMMESQVEANLKPALTLVRKPEKPASRTEPNNG